MQPTTVIILACLVAVVAASHYETQPDQAQVYESVYDAPLDERGARTKRGALGLKAAKVGAVGAGVVGAVALKKSQNKQASRTKYIDVHSRPSKYVEVQSWSG